MQLLKPPGASAGFKSALDVIDDTGRIVDVSLLFDNVKSGARKSATARVDDVEE